jgi:hypothetical protein
MGTRSSCKTLLAKKVTLSSIQPKVIGLRRKVTFIPGNRLVGWVEMANAADGFGAFARTH